MGKSIALLHKVIVFLNMLADCSKGSIVSQARLKVRLESLFIFFFLKPLLSKSLLCELSLPLLLLDSLNSHWFHVELGETFLFVIHKADRLHTNLSFLFVSVLDSNCALLV